ncbi:MAG TPA: hypothetical protein VG053_08690 [Solirubrobacteraceae bacterium]|jgi:hypothetical protein|nr:hypothetical protein [Solirubrobacteraceae bacterium]
MTQLSRPYQIALVTLALLALVWFAALRHRAPSSGGGSGSSPAASGAPATPPSAAAEAKAAAAPTHVYHGAAPGVGGLTRAIDKAHGAVAQSQQEAHRVETSEPSVSSAPAASASRAAIRAPARPATVTPVHVHAAPPAVKHLAIAPNVQATVEHELQQRKTVLILFWNRHGSDDMAVHNALPAVQHALGGRVAVHYATASQVGEFGTITHAIQVTQTPTLLIVNPHGQTTVLTGLTDAFAIQQAVSESRHS